MKARYLGLLTVAVVAAGAVHAQSPNWLVELMVIRAPQTHVVRDPVDKGKFYLCWQDGTERYGAYFRKRTFDESLRAIPAGGSVSLTSVLSTNDSGWTTKDDRICWPR